MGTLGCDDDPATGVTPPASAKVPVNAGVATAVANKPFTFASGVPAFGTTTSTTVTLTSASAAKIDSGGKTAATGLRFGSCIYTVMTSTFVAPSPLAMGQTITVSPCDMKLNDMTNNASLTLGAASSGETPVGEVSIACTGSTCTVSVGMMMVGTFMPSGSAGG
jgi:hypothetical protein